MLNVVLSTDEVQISMCRRIRSLILWTFTSCAPAKGEALKKPSRTPADTFSRKLSLRFLAWVILEQQIQTETHDSIEDSRTALKLYRKYLEYQDAGVLETVLDNLYSVGVKSGFKVPQLEDSGVVATAVPGRLRGEDSGMIRSETATPQPRGE